MDVNNNRRPAQAQGGDAAAPAPAAARVAAETGDWRSQLSQESRQKVVNRIVEILKMHIPSSEGIHELKSVAMKYEEKIYVSATNQPDYLKKISMKLISMENKPRRMANSMQSNNATSAHNSQVPGVHTGMQSQVNSEGQPLSFPLGTNQSQLRQQLGSHNNTTSTGLQNSSTNLAQPSIAANVVNQGYGLQGVVNVVPVASTMCSNMVSNSQRQVQGRPQQQEQQQQQSQTSSQIFYPQHVHNSQMMKPQSSMQSHIQQQQQNLVQHNQIQPSQCSSVQKATSQAVFQQHSQSLLRQQQQNNQQQQGSTLQQSMLQSPQQQQLIGHHQNQMIVQQSSFLDMQQQKSRVIPLQSNYSNIHQQQLISQHTMHQQQLGNQGHTVGLQNQQIHGNQPCSSGLQSNQNPIQMSQHSKVPQQQMLSNSTQQQLMSQNQTQPGALRIQHQANSLQREVHQRIQASSPMLQQQSVIDQQKTPLQQQRANPEAPSNSTAQTGNENGTDWQEETYQKIKSLRDMYYRDLKDIYTKLSGKLAQHDSLPQAPTSDHIKKIKYFVSMMENLLQVLGLNKSEIQLQHKERLSTHEKHILYFVNNSNRPRKPGSSIKQGQPHQLQMQPNHAQTHYNQVNPQMQSIQGSIAATMHHNNMQQSPFSTVSAVSAPQRNMINMLQHATGVDLVQGSSLSSMQMVAASPLQQNSISAQHLNISALPSRSGANTMQSSLSSTLHPNSHMLQHQHSKQHEQQMLHNQHIRHQNQQQLFHKQQLMQQQRQMKQSHASLTAHHLQQLHQMADSNDLKLTQHMPVKTGVVQQHQSVVGQRMAVQHQSSISSPQLQQALSPQLSHHTSPQIDKQNTLAPLTKVATPLQSTSSPLVVPSPSTPLVQSPMPGESEKVSPGITSLPSAGNIAYQKAPCASALGQSLSIATPGISASPLLDEFSSLDGTHANVASISGTTSVDQPLQRLIKVASRMSPEVFRLTVSDISSFISMVDRIAGSAPGNGSRAAVGEDLVAMTRCRMQARNIYSQDVPTETKKMKRYTTSNVVSSCGSVYDGFTQRNGSETSDLESTATSCVKKRRVEVSHALTQEIKEINRRLVDTIVEIWNEGLDPSIQAAAPVDSEGVTIKCSFSAVAVGPSLKSHFASVQMSPIQPLRLRVPANYPKSSPILLDVFPVKNSSKDFEDISTKVKSRLSTSLRTLSEPMSLKEIASTWDACTREVISEYARQRGGGSFSSKYGTWENCLSGA
ncbi:hypothetical protein DM860_013052 [Cuscuta australis]|uniref:Uncharacterized protein n=1 Tax=Cuscuta australis TaxID=267555 RepID=A0A328D6B0_9ASTE|nr:hypothetical protein DM860_013052 [Cuscuta australis]